jgi:hypothetical protein
MCVTQVHSAHRKEELPSKLHQLVGRGRSGAGGALSRDDAEWAPAAAAAACVRACTEAEVQQVQPPAADRQLRSAGRQPRHHLGRQPLGLLGRIEQRREQD